MFLKGTAAVFALVAVSLMGAAEASALPDGLYLVLRSSHQAKDLAPLGSAEVTAKNDFRYLEPAEREPTVFLVLQKNPFVPLNLESEPKEDKEESTGKPRLQIQLSENQKKPLEDFTRAHLGETVAIVIGGDVITTHKVRTAITGGRFQITRCTKHACYTLYSRLLKDRDRSPDKESSR